jgi:hypothetical protein
MRHESKHGTNVVHRFHTSLWSAIVEDGIDESAQGARCHRDAALGVQKICSNVQKEVNAASKHASISFPT